MSDKFKPDFYGGLTQVPQYPAPESVSPRNASFDLAQNGGPNYRLGGLLTYEKPIAEWYGDIVVPPGQATILRAGIDLPNNCVQIRFVNVAGTPLVSINGGGARSLFNFDGYNNTEIKSLYLILGALDTATVQAAGTGD